MSHNTFDTLKSFTPSAGTSGRYYSLPALAEKFPNFIFTEQGDVVSYHGVGKLDWGFGPAGAEAVVTGSDVLVMKGEKIGALYAFVKNSE